MAVQETIQNEIVKAWENPMRKPRIGYLVVNISVGTSGKPLENAIIILEKITGQKPIKIPAKKTIRSFGIRKGEPIACKVTLRGKRAVDFLKKALYAVDYKLSASSFGPGVVSFGLEEHIALPDVKYDPTLGVTGLDVTVVLERPGYRIKRRRRARRKIPKEHRISKEETILYMQKEFNCQIT